MNTKTFLVVLWDRKWEHWIEMRQRFVCAAPLHESFEILLIIFFVFAFSVVVIVFRVS